MVIDSANLPGTAAQPGQVAASTSSAAASRTIPTASSSHHAPQQQPECIPLLDFITNIMKFVEANLSNNSTDDHCKEFVKQITPADPQPAQSARRLSELDRLSVGRAGVQGHTALGVRAPGARPGAKLAVRGTRQVRVALRRLPGLGRLHNTRGGRESPRLEAHADADSQRRIRGRLAAAARARPGRHAPGRGQLPAADASAACGVQCALARLPAQHARQDQPQRRAQSGREPVWRARGCARARRPLASLHGNLSKLDSSYTVGQK